MRFQPVLERGIDSSLPTFASSTKGLYDLWGQTDSDAFLGGRLLWTTHVELGKQFDREDVVTARKLFMSAAVNSRTSPSESIRDLDFGIALYLSIVCFAEADDTNAINRFLEAQDM